MLRVGGGTLPGHQFASTRKNINEGTRRLRTMKVSYREAITSMQPHWLSTTVEEKRSELKATVMMRPAIVMVGADESSPRMIAASLVKPSRAPCASATT